ncbi:MAG: hypothetical protein U0470_05715 [Anaerolineae bacterium]
MLGLAVLPYRRRRAAQLMRERLSELRADLRDRLTATFDAEVAAFDARFDDLLAPYRTFVDAEIERLEETAAGWSAARPARGPRAAGRGDVGRGRERGYHLFNIVSLRCYPASGHPAPTIAIPGADPTEDPACAWCCNVPHLTALARRRGPRPARPARTEPRRRLGRRRPRPRAGRLLGPG